MSIRLVSLDNLRRDKGIPYGRAQIYRKIKAGTFPAPVRIGAGRIAFVEAEVDAWIEARITERDAEMEAA